MVKKLRKKFHKKSHKKWSKKYNINRGSSMLAASGRILPQRFRTKLVYNDRLVMSGTTVPYVLARYRVNNVWDPSYSSGNYGCYGFRQYAVLYDKYICYGSKIQISAMANTDALVQAISVVPSPNNLSGNDIFANVDGMKYAKNGKLMSISNGGSPESFVNNYISVHELYGLRKNEAKFDPSLRMHTDGSNVNGYAFKDGHWFVVLRANQTSGAASLNAVVNVKITYYVEFFDRKDYSAPTALTQDSIDIYTADNVSMYTALGATGATAGVGPFMTHGETGTSGNVVEYGNRS